MPTGQLEVTVVEGKNLKDTDFFTKSDPYVLMWIMGPNNKKGEKFRTKTHKSGGKTPKWGDRKTFNIKEGDGMIYLEVFDDDIGKDDLIGKAAINLTGVFNMNGQPTDNWIVVNNNSGRYCGEVRFVLRFTGHGAAPAARVRGGGAPTPAYSGAPAPGYGGGAAHGGGGSSSCPSCRTQCAPGTKYCTSCGTKMGAPPPAAGGGSTCMGCQARLEPGAKFCTSCGTKVVAAAPSNMCSCGNPFGPSDRFCTVCGTKNPGQGAPAAAPPPDPTHCSKCHTPLAPGAKFCTSC
eukprot:CAMPEP_0206260442 /NCGR_PEP_ID=MMETSP0047_2-20121206/27097_1 /ASSEMBLY_ACC=CAM_ASM_000192 /TAXON_ID=195065 /ORGANISM="Chroomonas mesostigmatica_cf, Strain CCMP1168" /LENGTH=290 /DNA_ID=CAMNT_0053687537 /DNA_START=59 /DNA_END=927 /DNA_ORIENTATION=-